MGWNNWVVAELVGIIHATESMSGWLEGGGGSLLATMRKVWAVEDPTMLAHLLMEFVMAVDERQAPVAVLGVVHLLPAVIRYLHPRHLSYNTRDKVMSYKL